MPESPEGHVAVDLIGDDDDSARVAEGGQAAQGLSVPEDSGRVVWIGQDQETAFLVADGFQVIEVHRITPVRVLRQRIEDDFPMVAFRHQPERMAEGKGRGQSRSRHGFLTGVSKPY